MESQGEPLYRLQGAFEQSELSIELSTPVAGEF
jgi:hypothetical protein